MKKTVVVLITLFLWLSFSAVLETDALRVSLSGGKAHLPLRALPSQAVHSRLLAIESSSPMKFRSLALTPGGVLMETVGPGEVQVHQYVVDGELSVMTIEQKISDRAANSSSVLTVPKPANARVVLISTVGIACPVGRTSTLSPVQYHESGRYISIAGSNDGCQKTFQILFKYETTPLPTRQQSQSLKSLVAKLKPFLSEQLKQDANSIFQNKPKRRLQAVCPDETYDDGLGNCLPCNIFGLECGNCTSAGCTSCITSYYISVPGGNICVACDTLTPNCIDCHQVTGICTTCPNTHFLNDQASNTCQLCAPTLQGCLQCIGNTTCLTCIDHTFYYDGTASCIPCSDTRPPCLTCTDAVTCDTCANTHWPVGGVCTLCSVLMDHCATCDGAGPTNCLTCNDTQYYLLNSACSLCSSAALPVGACETCLADGSQCTLCFTSHFLNDTDGICYLCSLTLTVNCLTCSSNLTCLTCIPLTHYIDTNALCQLCSVALGTYCTQCVSNTVCTLCSAGSYHVNGNCYQCSFDPTLTPNCLECDIGTGSLVCTLCTPDYYVDAGLCSLCSTALPFCQTCTGSTTTCSMCNQTTHYLDAGSCVTCSIGCVTCNSADICYSCDVPAYYLSGQSCIVCTTLPNCLSCIDAVICTACVSTAFYIDANNACVSCSLLTPACTNCDQTTGACTVCPTTHFLNDQASNTCQPCVSVLPGCQTCGGNTTCLSCIDTTFYYDDGLASCFFCSNTLPLCLTCLDSTTCLTCVNSSYYPVGGVCTSCNALHDHCDTCDSGGACLTCQDTQHYLSLGQCIQCSSAALPVGACSTCLPDGSACLSCFTTHFLNSTDSFCYPCSITLSADCITCSSELVCITCTPLTHYVDGSGQCQLCSVTLGNLCTQCSSSILCTECLPSSYLLGGMCMMCNIDPTLTSNCIECDISMGVLMCTRCTLDYYVDLGRCSPCSNVLPFCQTCAGSTTICSVCNQTTRSILNGECVLCTTGCLTCSSFFACTSCDVPAYYLSAAADCILCTTLANCQSCLDAVTCTVCVNTTFYIDVNNACVSCSSLTPSCTNCHMATGACVTCPTTHFLNDARGNVCQLCLIALAGCQTCSGNTTCLSCIDTTFYYDGTSSCFFCYNTLPLCLTCSDATTCLTCVNSSYYPVGGVCTSCNALHNHCDTCNGAGPTNCLTCNDTQYYLLNSECSLCSSAALPVGTCSTCLADGSQCTLCFTSHFLNDTDGICYLCSETLSVNCLTCSSNQTCLTCTPLTHFVHTDNTCQLCNFTLGQYCTQCASSSVCIQCSAGSYLSGGNCLQCSINPTNPACLLCTGDTYPFGGGCINCSSAMEGCQFCPSAQTCTTCYNPYFVYDPETRTCRNRRWLKITSIKKVKYENTVIVGLSYSADVDPKQIKVPIPHSELQYFDIKENTHGSTGAMVGATTFEYFEVEGTCSIRIRYSNTLEGGQYQMQVSDTSGNTKVSLTFAMTSDNDELINYYEESYYSSCRGIFILYVIELTLAVIAFAISIPMQLKLAFLEPLSILIFLPLFASIFKKVDAAVFSIKDTNIAEPIAGLCILSICLLPYICFFISKLLVCTKKFKFQQGSIENFQHLIVKEWSFILGIIAIGFVPYLFRLCADYANLIPALVIIPIAYLACFGLTLYHFKKAPQLFGELSVNNTSDTIFLALGYLITNLFMGIVTAASRNTYAWYTFLVVPLAPITMLVFVAVRRPFAMAVQNIRCSLNFGILVLCILILNLSNVASSSFLILFYIGAAAVSLLLSIINLVYRFVCKTQPKEDRKEYEVDIGGPSRLELNSDLSLMDETKRPKQREFENEIVVDSFQSKNSLELFLGVDPHEPQANKQTIQIPESHTRQPVGQLILNLKKRRKRKIKSEASTDGGIRVLESQHSIDHQEFSGHKQPGNNPAEDVVVQVLDECEAEPERRDQISNQDLDGPSKQKQMMKPQKARGSMNSEMAS